MSFAPDTYTLCTDPDCPQAFAFRHPYPTVPHWHPKEPEPDMPDHDKLIPDDPNVWRDIAGSIAVPTPGGNFDANTPYVTKTGKTLTDTDIQALADEAELGYTQQPDGTWDPIAHLLINTTDAAVWAHHFKHQFGDVAPDEGTMIGWFANAIETGRNAGQKAYAADLADTLNFAAQKRPDWTDDNTGIRETTETPKQVYREPTDLDPDNNPKDNPTPQGST